MATGFSVTQGSSAQVVGAVNYTGLTSVTIDGNLTTSGGIITITGPLSIANNPTLDTTNVGGVPGRSKY